MYYRAGIFLVILAGCRGGSPAPANDFASEEKAVLTSLQKHVAPDVQVISWGPHWRFGKEDEGRSFGHLGAGSAVLRVVFRARDDSGEWQQHDRIIPVARGVVPDPPDRLAVPGLPKAIPGEQNWFGDDWIERARGGH